MFAAAVASQGKADGQRNSKEGEENGVKLNLDILLLFLACVGRLFLLLPGKDRKLTSISHK